MPATRKGHATTSLARCSCSQPCAGEGSTAPSSSCHLHRRLQARLAAKQSPRNRHTRGSALCCLREPADSRLGELRRNRELPSLVPQVLTTTTPLAAVPEPLVTSKTSCSAVTRRSYHGGNLQLRQPCWSQSELSLPGIGSHLLHGVSFSGAIRNPPGRNPVQPAVGEPALAVG